MNRWAILFLLVGTVSSWAGPLPVAPAGTQLAELLDELDVEHYWLPEIAIPDWKYGRTDGTTGGPRTHCSLFASAVCWHLGVPCLNPPPQTFLSNRQQVWLQTTGKHKGWKELDSAVTAQKLANAGVLVLVSWKSPEPKKPGHIAIVRPAAVTTDAVTKFGPRIVQAGGKNANDTTAKVGFRFHPGAFEQGELKYFAFAP
jgi:hypothetical protein